MKRILPTIALAIFCSGAQAATVLNYSFSTDATPAVTGSSLVGSVSTAYAYLETVDGNGDPLPLPSFRPDLTAGPIVVGDPSAVGWGAAISGNALDARDHGVLLSFTSAQDVSAFSIVLDNSSFGTLFGTEVQFYSATDTLIGSITVDQTSPGFTVNDTTLFAGVSKILLPSGAFYDNLSITASPAPEPGRAMLLGVGLVGAILRRRRPVKA